MKTTTTFLMLLLVCAVSGQTTFSPQQVITTTAYGAYSVYATDLDGDGDADVLSASQIDDKIAWYENLGSGNFGTQQVITTAANGAYSVYATDLDGDGDADVLSASQNDDKIAWYENLGGGSFSAQQVITTAADGARSVYATDLDGDGDADVLSASNDDKIAWYENLGGGSFGAQQVITTAADGAFSVYATDLDGDGDADVLSASVLDDKIAWYENLGGGSFGPQQVITTSADYARSVYATDLDGDGDADVLSASQIDDKIAWYENLGGGSFGAQQVITTAADVARSVYATDLDGDGDADVLSASYGDDKIAWYENLGGGSFGAQQVITTAANGAFSVYATDLDGDGDADVLSASPTDDNIAWYENLTHTVATFTAFDGCSGPFPAFPISCRDSITECPPATPPPPPLDVDFDASGSSFGAAFEYEWDFGDGSPVLTVPSISGPIFSHSFVGQGSYWVVLTVRNTSSGFEVKDSLRIDYGKPQPDIDLPTVYNQGYLPHYVCVTTNIEADSAYVDWGDGTITDWFYPDDTVHCHTYTALPPTPLGYVPQLVEANRCGDFFWGAASDGAVSVRLDFAPTTTIAADVRGLQMVHAADLDGDSYPDLLSAGKFDDQVAWYRNNLDGTYGPKDTINANCDQCYDVKTADIDLDGDLDVVAAAANDNQLAWFENDGGTILSGKQSITTALTDVRSVEPIDVDGDGDMDIAGGARGANLIAWFENLGGTFGPLQIVSFSTPGVFDLASGDLDGDGDVDLVSANKSSGKIDWYENTGGAFGAQTTIMSGLVDPNAVHVADVDGDGDMDVLSASTGDGKVAWYQNSGGVFAAPVYITEVAQSPEYISTGDYDNDGDLDVSWVEYDSDKVRWAENDGSGTFTSIYTLNADVDGAIALFTADLDQNGVDDLVSGGNLDQTVNVHMSTATCRIATYDPLADTITICAGSSVVLDAGAGYGSYVWSTGDEVATTTVSAAGLYRVDVVDSAGCIASDSTNVILGPSIDPPVFSTCPADITVTSDGPVSWATPTAADNCYGPVTITQVAGPPSGSVFSEGTTTITYTVTDTIGQSNNCVFEVTVNYPCATPTGLTSFPASSGVILNWLDDDPDRLGVQIKGRKLGDAGFATLQTTATSVPIGGLLSSTSYEWKLRAKCLDGDISGFSPLDTFTTLSLREGVELPELKLSPNPATTSVTVLTTGHFETMTITDLLGRVFDQRQVTDSYTEVDVKGWSAGVYLVTLEGESGKLTEQLVVE